MRFVRCSANKLNIFLVVYVLSSILGNKLALCRLAWKEHHILFRSQRRLPCAFLCCYTFAISTPTILDVQKVCFYTAFYLFFILINWMPPFSKITLNYYILKTHEKENCKNKLIMLDKFILAYFPNKEIKMFFV